MSNTDIKNIPVVSSCTVLLRIDTMLAYTLKTHTFLQLDMSIFRINVDFHDQSGLA